MKKILFIVALFLLACAKENAKNEISDCITLKVENFKTAPRLQSYSSVSEYILDKKLYYYFDYGAGADWPGCVLDSQCDTICTLGFLGIKCKVDNFFVKATKVRVVFE
jgi:hypothetical protein